MMARCDPGATALPESPADRLPKSGLKSWIFVGADHVPGDPDVKIAPDRFTKTTDSVNSIGARPIPVLQSSAVESSSPRPEAEKVTAELYTAPVMVLMIWNCPGPLKVSTADRMRCRTGSTETFSLVCSPNKPIFVPNVLGGVKGSSAPTLLESPSAIHAKPVAASKATPHVSHVPPEKLWNAVAVAVGVDESVVPLITYTSFTLPVHTVVPVTLSLEHEFTGPVVATVVDAPGAGSSGTTLTPGVPSVQLPSGTYAVTFDP